MFQDTYTVYITLHITPKNPKRIAVNNVPVDITCGQFLQKIAPIIYENEPKKHNQDQDAVTTSDFNYCLKIGDKILSETEPFDSEEVDVIQRPEEITNLANISIFLSLIVMYVFPLIFIYYYRKYVLAYHIFIFGAFLFGFFVKTFKEKKNYRSFTLKIRPKKNSIFEALVLLIRSFNPNFRLEDVLLDQ